MVLQCNAGESEAAIFFHLRSPFISSGGRTPFFPFFCSVRLLFSRLSFTVSKTFRIFVALINIPFMMKLPIGIQDFEKLRTGGYLYVDKTEHGSGTGE